MKYLSFDLEATGLAEHDLIIEFGMTPFCTEEGLNKDLSKHFFIQCPSFEELRPKLDPWVIEHNKELIDKAHETGINLIEFKKQLELYLESSEVKEYFKDNKAKIVLFGKSINAIDLPFLNRDLGWGFMRKYFHHQVLDLSSTVYSLIDLNLIPKNCVSGTDLMNFLEMGDVCHTALEDADNTALMYLKLLQISKQSK
jgi:oligoribonuclease (3'-5' exoribonuclease)